VHNQAILNLEHRWYSTEQTTNTSFPKLCPWSAVWFINSVHHSAKCKWLNI